MMPASGFMSAKAVAACSNRKKGIAVSSVLMEQYPVHPSNRKNANKVKNIMKKWINNTSSLPLALAVVLAVWLSAISTTTLAATPKTVVLDVPGMTCKFCPITIRKALQKIPGVEKVKAEFSSKTVTVTFDADKTSVDALLKATANAGYTSTLKE